MEEKVWFKERETRRHLFASVAGELTPFRLGRQREKKGRGGGRSASRITDTEWIYAADTR